MDRFQQSYNILASDMDMNYHVTPNAILLYFQDCFARSLSSRHIAAFDIIGDHLIWIISEFEVRFLKTRPLWSSAVKVRITFSEIASIRIHVDFEMCNSDDEVFAEGSSVWAVINTQSRRPFPAAEMMEQAGITSSGHHHGMVAIPEEGKTCTREVEHRVNVTDLDFNGHVCNRTYLQVGMATLPVDFVGAFSPTYLHIRFIREAFLGDLLTCRISEGEENRRWFDICNESGKEICKIYSEWQDEHEELSRNVADKIVRDSDGGSMKENLGIVVTSREEGVLKAEMPVDQRTCQPFGYLNGGASLALAEMAAGYGSLMYCAPDEFPAGIQVSGNHIYMVPVGSSVEATATLVHKGRTNHVWNVDIRTQEGRLASTSRVVNQIVRKENK